MSDKINVRPEKKRLINLLEDVGRGEIKIPIFQREFVWDAKQILELFDSISKGYPIGSLLFWNPDVEYPIKKNIEFYKTKENNKKNLYVLDGSQRITTLFVVLTNPDKYETIEVDEKIKKKFIVSYDLRNKDFVNTYNQKRDKQYLIPLYKIIDTYQFLDFLRDLEKSGLEPSELRELIDEAKSISNIFYDYEIPYIEIKGGDIRSAVEIFSRVNSTGMEISTDFMLSARSYNNETKFLLSNEIDNFLTQISTYNFDKLKRDTILYCICNVTGKIYFDVKIEELLEEKMELEKITKETFSYVEKTIDFLYKRLFVLSIDFLPYPTQLIFMANFFRLVPEPDEEKLLALENWFWTTTYSNYFTIYSLSQQRTAHNTFIEFINNNHKDGISQITPFSVLDFPNKLNFVGVRQKALQLFLLKNICEDETLQLQESVKEFFIFSKKDRTPANIILRLSSEFEKDKNKREIQDFILKSDIDVLLKYFFTEELRGLYIEIIAETNSENSPKIEQFIKIRSDLMQKKEQEFINKFIKNEK